jgi:hypothetical protein
MQVLEEEELAAMRAHQEHFEQVRNAELVATQRMEQAERRKVEEKERRLQQERARLQREKIVREKVAASTFARGYLTGMVDSVIDSLWSQGFFYDPVERAVADDFMPWLRDQVAIEAGKRVAARGAIAALLMGAMKNAEAMRVRSRVARQAQATALAACQVRATCNCNLGPTGGRVGALMSCTSRWQTVCASLMILDSCCGARMSTSWATWHHACKLHENVLLPQPSLSEKSGAFLIDCAEFQESHSRTSLVMPGTMKRSSRLGHSASEEAAASQSHGKVMSRFLYVSTAVACAVSIAGPFYGHLR